LCFATEALLKVGVAGEIGTQDLDGNPTIKAHVATGEDLGHATATDHLA
jgi:hypothetical protein